MPIFAPKRSIIFMISSNLSCRGYASLLAFLFSAFLPMLIGCSAGKGASPATTLMPNPNASEPPVNIFDCLVQPGFPGGEAALQKFVAENFVKPASMKAEAPYEKVVVQIIVEKDGTLSNIKCLTHNKNQDIVAEAIRVVQAMPKWRPGKDQEGRWARISLALPIRYYLP